MKVNVIGGEMNPREIDEYIAYVGRKYPGRQLRQLDIIIDGEYRTAIRFAVVAKFVRGVVPNEASDFDFAAE